jgi:hypothetical protein
MEYDVMKSNLLFFSLLPLLFLGEFILPPVEASERGAMSSVFVDRAKEDQLVALDQFIDGAIGELIDDLQGKSVIVSGNYFYNKATNSSPPFALLLKEKTITALNRSGVPVVFKNADVDENTLLLIGQWYEEEETVFLSIKFVTLSNAEEYNYEPEIKLKKQGMSPQLFKMDFPSFARDLVRKLDVNNKNILNFSEVNTVYIRPFSMRENQSNGKTSQYFGDWIRPSLSESRQLLSPVDSHKLMTQLNNNEIRERGIRPAHKRADLENSLTGDLLGVSNELTGKVFLSKDSAKVSVYLNHKNGNQKTTANIEIPKKYLPPRDFTPAYTPTSMGLSNNGLQLDITTTRGEGSVIYHNKEKIQFVVRLNNKAYFYIFNTDSSGDTILLYPMNNKDNQLQTPNQPFILPDDGMPYDLEVSFPFGQDLVWAVASEIKLDIPDAVNGNYKDKTVLQDQLRIQGLNSGLGYAEKVLRITTSP